MFKGHCGARRMQALGADWHAVGKIVYRIGEIAAPLVATPIEQQFFHADTAIQQRAGFAVARCEDVVHLHGGSDADMCGFVAKR